MVADESPTHKTDTVIMNIRFCTYVRRRIKLAVIVYLLSTGITTAQQRPNIILIMADDMGFSDIGCYGSEIPTPHLDRLAANGIRLSQFYNTARCCPTRASLMTGSPPLRT